MEQWRFMWVPGAEVMALHVPVWIISHASQARCLLYAVCVNGLLWHVESCFSSSAVFLLGLILRFQFCSHFWDSGFRLSSNIMMMWSDRRTTSKPINAFIILKKDGNDPRPAFLETFRFHNLKVLEVLSVLPLLPHRLVWYQNRLLIHQADISVGSLIIPLPGFYKQNSNHMFKCSLLQHTCRAWSHVPVAALQPVTTTNPCQQPI